MCVKSVTSPCWPGMIRFNPFSIASGHSFDNQILHFHLSIIVTFKDKVATFVGLDNHESV